MLASRWLKHDDVEGEETSRERGFYPVVERFYMRILEWAMAHRIAVVVLMVLVFFSTVPLGKMANKNFLPSDDEGQFDVIVRAPEGANVDTTRKILESIGERVRKIEGVTATLLTIGDDAQLTQNLGTIYVRLAPVKERKESQFAIMDRVRNEVLPHYEQLNLRAQVTPVNAFRGGSNAEIQFWIGGPDLTQLAAYSKVLLETMKAVPGVVDADTNLIEGKPELGARIDRAKAADLGVNVQDLATTLNVLVGGQKVSDYYEGGEQYEVRARAEERDRSSAAALAQARVPARQGTVALRDIVRLEEGTGPSLVNRIARQRQVLLTSNVKPGFSSQAVIDALNAKAKELNMPAGYTSGLTGRSREQGKAAAAFLTAFVLSIIFMYLILAAQFESWIHPISILLALPLTVPFALLSIVVLQQSINIFSSLGILVLFGIVKKNGILQIDNMIALRNQGVPRAEAILRANRDRLRPILMTTLAFVAGMLPLVISSGVGAGTNRAIASVIIGGQTLALILTLIGTPVAYSIFDDWSVKKPFRTLLGKVIPALRAKESAA
jgi:HAE1 family hydrophobic/amphiphilic exporter-1